MSRPDLTVGVFLQLSTAHVRASTARALNASHDAPVAHMTWPYGWLVYVADDLDACDWPDLAECFAIATAAGVSWIRFDEDLDPTDALTRYEWTDPATDDGSGDAPICGVCGKCDAGNTCCPDYPAPTSPEVRAALAEVDSIINGPASAGQGV